MKVVFKFIANGHKNDEVFYEVARNEIERMEREASLEEFIKFDRKSEERKFDRSRTESCEEPSSEFEESLQEPLYVQQISTSMAEYRIVLDETIAQFNKENNTPMSVQEPKQQTRVEKKKKKFECKICNKQLTSKQNAQIHEESVHGNVTYLLCDLCPKIFHHLRYLRRHQMRAHVSQENLLQCPFEECNVFFSSKLKLRDHKKIVHDGEKL